jgi:diguanylate cyclase (GGDEF)-like protein
MSERILIADDDADILRFVEVNLSLEGFEILTASDGEDAFKQAITELPDLVLLDVMMPKMDGFEVCQRLRDDPRTSNLSIIMITAKSLSADKVVGLSAGADDYITKPFDPIELVARVKSTLRRAKANRDVNPLTGLSGNVAIMEELQRRITLGKKFALMHIDLDNFKAFNDHYGFMHGDTAIKLTAAVIREAADQISVDSFIGHIGGDDFVAITAPEVAEDLAGRIITCFDDRVGDLYQPADRDRGFISVEDRRGVVQEYPRMTISVGVASNVRRQITSHVEASEIASELKELAKREKRSSYAVDRRAS